MIENNNLDWAMGELLAYGSLMKEGFPVRFSGQDVERGTFSHRHAIVKIEDSEEDKPSAVAKKKSRRGTPRFRLGKRDRALEKEKRDL